MRNVSGVRNVTRKLVDPGRVSRNLRTSSRSINSDEALSSTNDICGRAATGSVGSACVVEGGGSSCGLTCAAREGFVAVGVVRLASTRTSSAAGVRALRCSIKVPAAAPRQNATAAASAKREGTTIETSLGSISQCADRHGESGASQPLDEDADSRRTFPAECPRKYALFG